MAEFKPYGKTPRLFREVIITEKIDGSNAGIHIEPLQDILPSDGIFTPWEGFPPGWHYAEQWLTKDSSLALVDGVGYRVTAQSRNRIVTPNRSGFTTDNYGFAAWVHENRQVLVEVLGKGLHYGEWYGKGVNYGYGLDHKRFALFAVDRYDQAELLWARKLDVPIETVPELWRGTFSEDIVMELINDLRTYGTRIPHLSQGVHESQIPKAEGLIVYHTQSRQVYKVLCENDELPKSLVA